jgi:hypothetical protein
MRPLSNNWRNSALLVVTEDRRCEPRERADGLVRLFTVREERLVFEGDMVDVSHSGFRLEHTHQRISSGEEYIFESPYTSGIARVMWNRILAKTVETGFLIVSQEPED